MDSWSSGGTAAALSQMGWPESSPTVGGRKPGDPFQLAGTSTTSIGEPRWPLYGITPADVQEAKYGANLAQQNYEAQIAAKQATMGGAVPGATGSTGGTSLGGDWAGVDQWNAQIAKAQQDAYAKTGVMVPINVIKSIMKIESNGEWQSGQGGVSPAGYFGLMQVGPGSWGYGTDWDPTQAFNDPGYNLFAGTMELARRYQDSGGLPWDNVAVGYFSGHYYPNGAGDDYNTDYDYQNMFNQYYNQLNSYGGATSYIPGGGQVPATGTGNALQSMFGVSTIPDWGEFNVPSGNGLYGYGTEYGLDGSSHTGIDVPMNPGSPYSAPMGGTVMCAGTGVGQGTDGGGCAAFGCYGYCVGGSAGRVEVLLDNGAVLIYGHSSTAALAPGTRFTAGTILGTSGGENSGHVHLEARVRDASMPSGWRIVDPRSVLGGGSYPGYSGGSATGAPQQQQQQQPTGPSGFGFTNFWLNQYRG